MKDAFNRRRFVVSAASAALIGPALVTPANAAVPQFEAYHGKTGQHHQARFNALHNGWRMISLSVHGAASSPLYSAVWVREAGPSYVAVHGLPIGQYQQWFNQQTGAGYAPALVSATGGAGDAVVAAVFERGATRPWTAKHGLVNGDDNDPNTIEYWCKRARQERKVLRSAAVYGSGAQRRYIAVWREEPEAHWSWRTAENPSNYQTWFNAFDDVPLRPGFVTLSGSQAYLAAFRDDPIGEWVARHGLTSDAYQAEFNTMTGRGFYPICVQGGGVGSATRYAAIFAKRHTPLPRQWRVRGSGLAAFDNVVRQFMTSNGVRAGQLTVAKNGVMKAQRAYTWADAGYPTTEVTHLMRIASLSKMFTAACIQQIYNTPALSVNENTEVFARLGITQKALASQTVDGRVNDITVEHLVDHLGGWDSGAAGDWAFKMRQVAQNLGLAGPPTKRDLVRHMYGEPLQFTPGMGTSKYSNMGYITLALLVERVTGQTYETYLRNTILQPDGITEVRRARTLRSQRLANEAFYDDPNVGLTAAAPGENRRTAYCYGGEGWVTEAMDGSGGLCATANALVQFIRRHAVWGRGGRAAGSARTGGMAGVTSRAESRNDGVDFAFVFNTRHLQGTSVDAFTTSLKNLISATPL